MPDYKKLMRKRSSLKDVRKPRHLNLGPRRDIKKIAPLVIFTTLIICVFFGIRSFLLQYPGLAIERISVIDERGQALQNPADFFYLQEEASLFSFDLKKAVQDIKSRHPELSAVFIRRQFPRTLVIVVQKRKGVAVVGIENSYSVDQDGFILPYEAQDKGLPIIVGLNRQQIKVYAKSPSVRLKNVLSLLEELERARVWPQYKILKIDVRQYSNIIFYLEKRIEVRMGQEPFRKKAVLLSKILDRVMTAQDTPKYIDMRFDNPVVAP